MNITEYVDYLYGRGYSERTVGEYRKWIRRMMVAAAERGHTLETLPPAAIREWADTLPYTWATRKQARAALRHWCRWTGRGDEPWFAIRQPRKPRPQPRPHEANEAKLFHDAAIMIGGRFGLAVLLLLYTGARASEVAELGWDGIATNGTTVRWWRTKISDWHEIPLAGPLAEALEQSRRHATSAHVFPGNNGRPHVTATTIWEWTKRVAATAGVETSPKRLRSTVGNLILDATGDIDAAAEILGHSSVETTRTYYTTTSRRRMAVGIGALVTAYQGGEAA